MTLRLHAAPWRVISFAIALFTCVPSFAQSPDVSQPVLPLYRKLQAVGINPDKVFKIREAALDREDVHLSFNDGVIGFLRAVDGHVTGAYFEGDGEVLIRPPDRQERASLGLFTGEGVLEEKFSSAYLRFSDDAVADLEPYLRPLSETAGFFEHNDPVARNLAVIDAIRLTILLTSGPPTVAPGAPPPLPDRLLHARVAGERLGIFDVYFDTRSPEQIVVGKASSAGERTYYDLWMSFPMRSLRKESASSRFHGPTGPAWTRDALAVTKYTVNSIVAPPTELSAEATLDMEVKQGGSRVVLFELSRYLKVKKVELEGAPLEFIQNEAVEGSELSRRGNDLVAVGFPAPLQLGSRFRLLFTYAGSVLSDAGGGLVYVGARGTWYPNRGVAMANYDLTFRFPQTWTLVATGKRLSLDREGGDFVGHWVSEHPIPIAGFNLGQYFSATARAGDIKIFDYAARGVEREMGVARQKATESKGSSNSESAPAAAPTKYGAAPDPSQQLAPLADKAAETVASLSQMLGPFPFTTLSLTQRPGMESQGWPTLIFLSSYVYLTSAERMALNLSPGDNIVFGEIMMPHELAHQWFGDKVSWASYHEQWLLEALANYSALMLLERTNAADAEVLLETYRSSLAARNKAGKRNVDAGPVTLGARLSSSKFPSGYEIITYGRGTWLIHMLRAMLRDASRTQANPNGDDTQFLAILRNLIDRNPGKELTNASFEKAFEEVLPRSLWFEGRQSLDWFFDGWVNGTALPQLQLAGANVSGAASSRVATGTIRQNSAPADLVTSVPVYGIAGVKRVYLGRVFAEGAETKFTLHAPAEVTRLVLDPYATVLTAP
jgi:hypothetical protein